MSAIPIYSLLAIAQPTLLRWKIIAFSLLANHFLLFWLAALVVVGIGGWWLHGFNRVTSTAATTGPHPGPASVGDKISVVILLAFAAAYIGTMLYGENFSFYDGNLFTDYSLQARSFPPPIWPGVGRFHPLFLQEFNALRFVTRSTLGFHAFAAAELIAVILALFYLLRAARIAYRVPILVGVLLAPSFVLAFVGLPYAERNILLWLALMLVFLSEYQRTSAASYFVGCLLATHFILYYKEIIVVFVVSYALSRIAIDLLVRRRGGQVFWQESLRGNALPVGMLGVALIYGAFFVAAIGPGGSVSFSYIKTHQVSRWSALLAYLRVDWLLFVMVAVLGYRLLAFLFAGDQLDLLWDPLACAAAAYFLCLVALRMFSLYYTAPCDMVAILYLGVLSLSCLAQPSGVRVAVVAATAMCLLVSSAAYSFFRVAEYKGIMSANGRLRDFLLNYRPADGSGKVTLFFPYADGFRLEELAAYLRYSGLNLSGDGSTASAAGPALLFEGREAFPGNHCVDFKQRTCVHADSAGDGGLIVVLPDDRASTRDLDTLRQDANLRLAANPCGLCTRTGSWVRALHASAGYFWQGDLPDHWLQLHVLEKAPAGSSAVAAQGLHPAQ